MAIYRHIKFLEIVAEPLKSRRYVIPSCGYNCFRFRARTRHYLGWCRHVP